LVSGASVAGAGGRTKRIKNPTAKPHEVATNKIESCYFID
jgi:hypothetical protein